MGISLIPGISHLPLIPADVGRLDHLRRARKFVIIAGPLPEPRRIFEKAELEANLEHVIFASDVEQAQEIAIDLVTLNPDWGASRPPVAAA